MKKPQQTNCLLRFLEATLTGLEPATTGSSPVLPQQNTRESDDSETAAPNMHQIFLNDPKLIEVIQNWDELPLQIQKAIAELCQVSGKNG